LSRFKKLRELERRLKRERDEPYEWLRVFVENPPKLEQSKYVALASDMYRKLVELHLPSGKSSRAKPAAHYCAIVYELSLLLEQPALWSDLLEHLKREHGRKRVIWERLAEEACPIE
jgi:hypothetical protein